MTKLSALEDVVRVIFPSTMMREGELLPAAFKLREHDGEAEARSYGFTDIRNYGITELRKDGYTE